jgi:hypothetical protein
MTSVQHRDEPPAELAAPVMPIAELRLSASSVAPRPILLLSLADKRKAEGEGIDIPHDAKILHEHKEDVERRMRDLRSLLC